MLAKKKCTNVDCRDYDVECIAEIGVDAAPTIFCPTCFLGKLNITLEHDSNSLHPKPNEEFISADFDLKKIFQR